MVRKMTGPDAISANALSREMGIPQTVLSRWLRLASEQVLSEPEQNLQGAMSMSQAKRPKDWSPEEKLHVVLGAQSLAEEELGAFLRKNGLYEAHLKEWREQILAALAQHSPAKTSKMSSEQRRIRELEKELDRKDKALAETAALLVLQKKARILFGGDGVESTQKRNGK
jgi:transposase-like protein